jgi:hypothetical protein
LIYDLVSYLMVVCSWSRRGWCPPSPPPARESTPTTCCTPT